MSAFFGASPPPDEGLCGPQTPDAEVQKAERIRVQELLRYFQPVSFTDDKKPSRISSDQSLTAYAQLACFRLNCQRAFISLVDHDKQYIIAEATRTISLQSDDIYDVADDAIFLGPVSLDLVWGMCAATIPTFTSTDGHLNITAQYMKTDRESFVIHDMSKVDSYKDRPYVTGWPHMRYYAEVPISSPNGLCIGSICTVDDKPRESMSRKDMTILQDIASTIMDHLDLLSSRVQRGRAEQMIRGFGIFADARETKSVREDRFTEIVDRSRTSSFESRSAVDKSSSEGNVSNSTIETENSVNLAPSPEISPSVDSMEQRAGNIERFSQTLNVSTGVGNPVTEMSIPKTEEPYSELTLRIMRAANLMRDALDLEGITIFDRRHEKLASELANFATIVTSSTLTSVHSSPMQVAEAILSSTINRLPYGGVLQFGPQGNYMSYHALKSVDILETGNRGSLAEGLSQDDSPALAEEAELLNTALGSRTMILFPLWSTSADKLFAYAIGYTSVPSRVFQREDFAYLASFSNLVTAELFRLDVIAADRAKSDFISSISHELRSPLHGIMASIHLLKDHITGTLSTEMFNTIEACGSTLADTLNNLLTFAKINNFTATHNQEVDSVELIRGKSGSRKWSNGNLYDSTSITDLGNLVEEVMKSSIAGHQMRADLDLNVQLSQDKHLSIKPPPIPPLSVICDIQKADWRFKIQPGTWKRIIMNLLGNSLKYTSLGFIRVKLSLEEDHTVAEEPAYSATLTVEDTGRGIADTFLTSSLYKPFRQENALQPGTGLGLSIVKQLVGSIGGHINIASSIGLGTTVTVTAMLARESTSLLSSHFQVADSNLSGIKSGQTVGLFGLDTPPLTENLSTAEFGALTRRNLALTATLKSTLKDYGLHTVTVTSLMSQDAAIIIIPEEIFCVLDPGIVHTRTVPLIILSSAIDLDYRQVTAEGGLQVYLSQPFGPQRLAQVLGLCFDSCQRLPDPIAEKVPADIVSLKSAKDNTVVVSNDPIPTFTKLSLEETAHIDKPAELASRANALLVEDNPVNMKILVMFMKKLKCSYQTATNGQEAVEMYHSAHGDFDIVLTDIQMPKKDGMQSTLEMRQYEQELALKRTPVIAITGLGSEETQNQARSSGVDLLLTKPMSFKTLSEVIETWVPRTAPK